MKIFFAVVFGALILGTFKAILRCLGVHFNGDIDRRTCANCGVENIEHKAIAQEHWLFWTATSEHNARCGLVCGNGSGLSREIYMKNVTEGRIHTSGGCQRCGPRS